MSLYRKATPDELDEAFGKFPANNSAPAANNSAAPANKAKRGRPVKLSGDPKRDAHNARQAGLMRKRRAAK